MPRTFKALEKRFIDNEIMPEGKVFTTNAFDKKGSVVPSTLEEQVTVAQSVDYDLNDPDLAGMKLAELKALAKGLQIDNYSTMNKDTIIMAIESIRETNKQSQETGTADGAGTAMKAQSINDLNIV